MKTRKVGSKDNNDTYSTIIDSQKDQQQIPNRRQHRICWSIIWKSYFTIWAAFG